jgi:hypothetical protein
MGALLSDSANPLLVETTQPPEEALDEDVTQVDETAAEAAEGEATETDSEKPYGSHILRRFLVTPTA